ncbi:MAG: hypothetical protein AAGB34_04315 [Planctomycetota bacterium]
MGRFEDRFSSGTIGKNEDCTGLNMPGSPKEAVLTITDVKMKGFEDGDEKPVLSFEETDMDFIVNGTNWRTISEITGCPDDADWLGHQICLYLHKLDRPFQGHTHGVRAKAAPAQAVAPTAPTRPPVPQQGAVAPLGADGASRLLGRLGDSNSSVEELRTRLVEAGVDEMSIAGELETWPRHHAQLIVNVLESLADLPF